MITFLKKLSFIMQFSEHSKAAFHQERPIKIVNPHFKPDIPIFS